MKDQIDPPPSGNFEGHRGQLVRAYNALENTPKEAVAALIPLAEQGSAMGMLYLGYSLRHGIGIAQDVKCAEMWYRRAADSGLARAHYHLGRLYLDEQRYSDARAEFERAASRDFAPGMHFLGRVYYLGLGVPVDKSRGKFQLELAAQRGSVFAKALLAHDLIHGGNGVTAALKGALLKIRCHIELVYILCTEGFSSDRLR